jgi:hypothetical protein
MKVKFMKKIVLISSLSLFAMACSKTVGDEPREGSEPGQCEDGADNDGDGDFDCDDADCFNSPACGGNGDSGDPIDDGDLDSDNDGFTPNEGDCDDDDKNVHPDANEKCNNKDDDCDGTKDNDPIDGDTYYEDWDGDGYGDANNSMEACDEPHGYVENDDDCDDTNSSVHPGANEVSWNGTDEDCDGSDFNGYSCLVDSTQDALDYVSYFYYNVSDETGSYAAGSLVWEITNQTLWFDGDKATVAAGDGSTQFDIQLDAYVAMNSSSAPFDVYVNGLYGTYVESCTGYVGWMPITFEGSVSMVVNGTTVTPTVNLSPVWDGLIQDDMTLDSGCNLSTINWVVDALYAAGYIPFSNLLSFFDDNYQQTLDALTSLVEGEIAWYVDYNCAG